jgi:death-on-curing protein
MLRHGLAQSLTIQVLTFEGVLEIHRAIMTLSGDRPQALLAEGALRAGIDRAAWGPFEGDGDLAERAALLLRAILQEHPFVDGNKRTGFAAAETLLLLNGGHLEASKEDGLEFVLDVAQGRLTIAQMAAWIREHAGAGAKGK